MPTPQSLVRNITSLVSLPQVYTQAKAIMDNPAGNIAQVGEIIAQDAALTVRLLKIVNSPFFGLASKISTVSRAIALLGFEQLHSLLLATSVVNAFKGISPKVIDMETFWWNSNFRGVAARLLADECNILDVDQLFVAGLLSDIGHLVMYQQIPEEAQQALLNAREHGKALYHEERNLLNFDYAQVGAQLCKAWQLPEYLHELILHHIEPVKSKHYELEVAIVHIANVMTLQFEPKAPGAVWLDRIQSTAWSLTGLNAQSIEHIAKSAQDYVNDTLQLFVTGEDTLKAHG